MARRKWSWTKKQFDKLNKVQEILEELDEYKPLTLRQVYYQLVGKGYIENRVSEYGMLSGLLKYARIAGYIPWEDIEDRGRIFHNLTGFEDYQEFISASYYHFLRGYRRNLLQKQGKYLEIWIEKDALSSIFTRTAKYYTVPVIVCRGFNSVSFLNAFKERIQAEDHPVVLYFGDFDPSGMAMLNSSKITLENEMNVQGVEFKRIALSKEDIFEYNLPHNPSAIKKKDTRTKKHVAQYGEIAVELDALPPAILEEKIRNAIEAELDMNFFKEEKREEENEFDLLNDIKKGVGEFLQKVA
ncbi:MAG: hypothetical protein K8T10_20015 [Candidatus Eremiobacteraeota bacterium]|nr:hypothetical protein [Candidatus Eremiobacteraeota bacterium]